MLKSQDFLTQNWQFYKKAYRDEQFTQQARVVKQKIRRDHLLVFVEFSTCRFISVVLI
jgi:hypothetical protein